MSLMNVPAVAVSNLYPSPPYVMPEISIAGGIIGMLFSVPSRYYKLVGFSASFASNNGGTGGGGVSSYTDGIVRMPIQILVLPSLNPVASGILHLLFEQDGYPGHIQLANSVTGYAQLKGMIYPGVTQILAVFVIPNTVAFNITENLASLILETEE